MRINAKGSKSIKFIYYLRIYIITFAIPKAGKKEIIYLMAKKQVAEKELKAKEAELQDTKGRVKETFESEADSLSIDEIKSSSRQADPEDFDWDADDKVFGN